MLFLSRPLAFAVAIATFLITPTADAATIDTKAEQAIIVDFQTGAVLMAKNADQQMPTSSMSKVISMYAVFDALKSGDLTLESELMVSEKAWRMGGSKMFVEVGKKAKVEDLIRGVIVQSGNDATIVLAEGLAGTEDAFAKLLNNKAKTIGMENSNFVNASGWPDENHYSTARDLSKLGRALITNFPEYYSYYAEEEFTYSDITQKNRNPLLYRDIGADGIKTGHTEAAGYGLIGSGVQDERRVVLVVNGLDSAKARAEESSRLLEWALKNFDNKTFFAANATVAQADVTMGKASTVTLVTQEDVLATVPKFDTAEIKVEAVYQKPLIAPVKKGQEVGTLKISIPDQEPLETPLYAGEDVPELGFVAQAVAKIKHLLVAGT
ncbi:MAG: D-alanyl-D-alanine carboxypeptidase [Alphaproteobacteria bacterium]|nr:D-alanyl-D-alanine carboxypeptidase [Alphaproteobacteria bacterium]